MSFRGLIVACSILLLASDVTRAELVPCHRAADQERIVEALATIRRSVDPWGESAEVVRVLDRFERCVAGRYEICTSADANRNLFERAPGEHLGTITWNPDLRSELQRGCGGDPTRPVVRDPVASLLHEIVHAADDCDGVNPGEHELEAVRIENIYRRAAGLCPRTRYGEEPLPVGAARREAADAVEAPNGAR
jgi:hypothetical protein